MTSSGVSCVCLILDQGYLVKIQIKIESIFTLQHQIHIISGTNYISNLIVFAFQVAILQHRKIFWCTKKGKIDCL